MDEAGPPKPPRRRPPRAKPDTPAGGASAEGTPARAPRRRAAPVAKADAAAERPARPRPARAGAKPRTPPAAPVLTEAARGRDMAPTPAAAPEPTATPAVPPAPVARADPAPRARGEGAAPGARAGRPADAEFVPSFARARAPTPAAPGPRPADTSARSERRLDALLARVPEKHRARAREYLVLMRMDRPVGALLLLWPTWWALWFAAGDFPPPGLLLVFTLGVFVMRSAGCVINDFADHAWLDAHVERTRGRPMAAGRVSRREALGLFAALLALAFLLVLFTNRLTILLSFAGAALAAAYPFAKRVTHLAQVVLGAAFGWSIPMAFAAVTGTLPPLCWLLFLANVLFSTVYDTEYAMVDREDDLRVGAKSTAILFGDADRAIIGVLMATFLFAMLLAGLRATLHWPYYAGLAVAAGLLARQQWRIRDRSREHCFAAFRDNNRVGLVIWLGLLLALAIR
jgi:4-hydroxybenzoate polyprenyltransferase